MELEFIVYIYIGRRRRNMEKVMRKMRTAKIVVLVFAENIKFSF